MLHYDWQDSVLLQISGSKRFTIIDPARMQTAYPCVQVRPRRPDSIASLRDAATASLLRAHAFVCQRMKTWERLSPGVFRGRTRRADSNT